MSEQDEIVNRKRLLSHLLIYCTRSAQASESNGGGSRVSEEFSIKTKGLSGLLTPQEQQDRLTEAIERYHSEGFAFPSNVVMIENGVVRVAPGISPDAEGRLSVSMQQPRLLRSPVDFKLHVNRFGTVLKEPIQPGGS
jgi:hypothetical protein